VATGRTDSEIDPVRINVETLAFWRMKRMELRQSRMFFGKPPSRRFLNRLAEAVPNRIQVVPPCDTVLLGFCSVCHAPGSNRQAVTEKQLSAAHPIEPRGRLTAVKPAPVDVHDGWRGFDHVVRQERVQGEISAVHGAVNEAQFGPVVWAAVVIGGRNCKRGEQPRNPPPQAKELFHNSVMLTLKIERQWILAARF